MRAFLYCRVAHDDSFALDYQRFLLQLYAKQAGYTIIGAADEYGSGLTLDRPALQKVTEAVVAGKVDVVLVHNLTRIGREWGMAQNYHITLDSGVLGIDRCVEIILDLAQRDYPENK